MTSPKSTPKKSGVQESTARYIALFCLVVLLSVTLLIFRPFVMPLAWAAIAVIGFWPLHRRLMRLMPKSPNITALISTFLIIIVIVAFVVPTATGVIRELQSTSAKTEDFIKSRPEAAKDPLLQIPLAGEFLQGVIADIQSGQQKLVPLIQEMSPAVFGAASIAAKRAIGFLFDFLVMTIAMFFLFRNAHHYNALIEKTLLKLDSRAESWMVLIRNTISSTFYGLISTAIAQGLLAGIGYAVAGAPAPTLLGFFTLIMSFVPYGTPLVYLPVSALIVLNGAPWYYGVLLAVWGTAVVSTADNVIKPLFIAQHVNLPLPFVLIGVLGGIAVFGFIGVFIGPLILAIVHALWLEWLETQPDA